MLEPKFPLLIFKIFKPFDIEWWVVLSTVNELALLPKNLCFLLMPWLAYGQVIESFLDSNYNDWGFVVRLPIIRKIHMGCEYWM